MKLHILGCYSPYPPSLGVGPGYLVEHGATKVLLDCGSGVVSNLGKVCNLQMNEPDAVILSHLHADHFCDLLVLRYARFLGMKNAQANALRVLAPDQPVLEYALLPFRDSLDLETINPEQRYFFGDIKFEFARTLHPYITYAVKATVAGKILVYTGDTAWSDELVAFCDNADLLLAEASFLEKNKGANIAGHLSASDAGRLATLAGVKKLVLTHFWPHEDLSALYEEAKTMYQGEVVLAATGLILSF